MNDIFVGWNLRSQYPVAQLYHGHNRITDRFFVCLPSQQQTDRRTDMTAAMMQCSQTSADSDVFTDVLHIDSRLDREHLLASCRRCYYGSDLPFLQGAAFLPLSTVQRAINNAQLMSRPRLLFTGDPSQTVPCALRLAPLPHDTRTQPLRSVGSKPRHLGSPRPVFLLAGGRRSCRLCSTPGHCDTSTDCQTFLGSILSFHPSSPSSCLASCRPAAADPADCAQHLATLSLVLSCFLPASGRRSCRLCSTPGHCDTSTDCQTFLGSILSFHPSSPSSCLASCRPAAADPADCAQHLATLSLVLSCFLPVSGRRSCRLCSTPGHCDTSTDCQTFLGLSCLSTPALSRLVLLLAGQRPQILQIVLNTWSL
ncbi:hypothetical protein J6590_012269 [Homalodisca vitripennis]|nr:hypothetical protein J6590_012269 [Homalodisca vitripennis]